jgi:hypothetical protein
LVNSKYLFIFTVLHFLSFPRNISSKVSISSFNSSLENKWLILSHIMSF